MATGFPPAPDELGVYDAEALHGPVAALPCDLEEDDMIAYVAAAIARSRLIGNNLDSFNRLVQEGIQKIVTQMFRIDITTKNLRTTPANEPIDHFGIVVDFQDAEVKRPAQSAYPMGQTADLYPNQARNTGGVYAAPLLMAAHIELRAHYKDGRVETKAADLPTFEVSQFPVMVGSSRCHTYNLTREALKLLQEDPSEQGGYFIAKGECSVEMLENIRFNSLHVHLGIGREVVRGEFISQPGGAFENSSQVVIRLLPSGALTIEINSMKFQKLQIPFYLFFRMFGMVSDAEIIEQVVGGATAAAEAAAARRAAGLPPAPPTVEDEIVKLVDRALHHAPPLFEDLRDELDRQVITERLAVHLERFVTNPQSYKNDEEAVRYLTTGLLSILDKDFLPHVGRTAAARGRKLRFLGMLIRKVLDVQQGVTPPTDRDSFVSKRVHGSGVSLAKAFKAMFNHAVIGAMVQALKGELKVMDFAKLTPRRIQEASRTMFTTSADLTRLMVASITSGNKVIVVKRRALLNRVSSNAIERKSPLNLVSSLRRITTNNGAAATKGTVRAEHIRAVHGTATGYICPYHSADTGEKVGMEKQMAVTTDVCDAGEAAPLVNRLLADPAVVRLTQVTNAEVAARRLARVFVNGDWVGCCADPAAFVARYRGLRRRGVGVSPRTTVAWVARTNEVEFWLDVGRITRPLLIVDNNLAAFDAGAQAAAAARERGEADWARHQVEFVQNVRYTRAHAAALRAGQLTLDGLVAAGVAEWVTPEEMESCLLAEDVAALYRARHNYLRPYTHCEVPQALPGLAAMVSPYANHTQPARITYETNQSRATCSWYCKSWPFRADQLRFFQFYNQFPLVYTLSSSFVTPSGMNTLVGYMPRDGNNQEDSAIVSRGAVQRGLFEGVLFRREVVTLETGEHFGTPDATTTRGMRHGASYRKLVDGFVTPGTRVEKGDVLVGRLYKEAGSGGRGAADAAYVDRSLENREDLPGWVSQVWKTQGPDDATFALVKLVYPEQLNIGDKMSSRAGNKSIVAEAVAECDLPYDEDGVRPDILINPHSIPSRMVIGQMHEAFVGLACARTGTSTDGTIFRSMSVERAAARLARLGFRESGHRRMFDPVTGDPLEMAMFVGPTYQQRLQKFVDLNSYAAPTTGPTDPITGQPREGKRSGGSGRLGEMERWVLVAKAATNVLNQKARHDADGRTAFYCRECGRPAAFNAALDIYDCPACQDLADIVAVPSTQASIVFQHELSAMGVDLRARFSPRRFERQLADVPEGDTAP